MGISSSAQAWATPFSRGSVHHSESSISTASIFATLAARRIVAALTSLSAMPPILPASTCSLRAAMVVSMSVLGSLRAGSNWWMRPLPPIRRTEFSTLVLTPQGVLLGRRLSNMQPLMLSRILSWSSGYFS